ncbi:hypothetical protein EEB11_18160 [Pseudotabrizicola sediminis]|uniref:Uncharacterized protein n=1 Tax=Pseudotabrizicola sediminis TaxID=2486418 RepID=A0ABY2KL18_9RHOB|nr:hypothetical protein [Pseudotabrizicola sediminis]TGD41542.1 hypothetical protein EEB11_18160 [Pseudotabrizicola sediminis]
MPEQMSTALALNVAVSHGNGLLEKLLDTLQPDVTDKLLSLATMHDVPKALLLAWMPPPDRTLSRFVIVAGNDLPSHGVVKSSTHIIALK